MCVFLLLLGCVIAIPVQLPADGHEYICTVASLLTTHNMVVEQEDLLAAADMVSPETFFVDSLTAHNCKRNKDGVWMWGSHSYYVSLLALPLVFLFGAKGFLLLNALCMMLALGWLYLHLREKNGGVTSFCLACACLLCSGALSYVFWINSEMVLFAALCGALYYGLRFRVVPAAILLAVATVIKPPLVLVFFPLVLWHLVNKRSLRAVLVMGGVFVLAGLPQLAYYYKEFGHYQARDHSPERKAAEAETAAKAADAAAESTPARPRALRMFKYVDGQRLWAYWLTPAAGFIWFYPAALWCLFRNRWPAWLLAALAGTAVLVSLGSLVPVNFLSQNTGAGVRYTIMVFPLFLFLAGTWKGAAVDWVGMGLVALLGGTALLDATHTATKKPDETFAKVYPSLALVRDFGFGIHPELLFQCGARRPRDVVWDYCDNENYLRHERCELTIRNMEPGDAILKLWSGEGGPSGTATLRCVDDGSVSAELGPNQVTTLALPLEAGDLVPVTFPEFRSKRSTKRTVPVARLEVDLPRLVVRSGLGELPWQTRYHGAGRKFLYRAGPRVLNVYPSRDWILQTMASEDLEGNAGQATEHVTASQEGVFASWDRIDKREGDAALRLRAVTRTEPVLEVVRPEPVSLDTDLPAHDTIEVSGWMKAITLEEAVAGKEGPQVAVMVKWIDAQDAVMKREAVWSRDEKLDWSYVNVRRKVPDGAKKLSLGILLVNAKGMVKVDDLVVSWYKDTWDLRN